MEEEGEGEGEGVDCQWKVRAASSEASAQSAHNILKQELYRIWQTREATDEAWLLLEPEFPVAFKSVEIVNAGTSLLEIYGLRAEGARDEFELLLPAQQLMSVKDLMSKSNRNRSFTYSVPHKLAAIGAEYKWKELKIVCRQPFGSADQSSCIGLSKLQVICCKTKSEISKAFAESLLETHMEARILEMFPSTSSVKVSPEGRKFESSIHSQHQTNSLAGSTISDLEVATPKKRRLPGWAFCNHNVNSQALDAKEDYSQKSSFPAKSADDSTERLVLEKGKGAFKKTEKKQEGSSLQRTNQIAQESITLKEIMRSFEVEERPKDDANKSRVRIKAGKSISSDNISDEIAKKKGKEKGSELRSLSKSGFSYGEPSPGNKGVITIKRGFQVGQYLSSSQEKLEADNTKQVQKNLDVFPLSPSDSNGIRDSIEHATSSWVISNNKDLKASANSAVHDSVPKVGSTTFSQAGKQASRPFSKLLEGVIFAISGVVNPERAELRKKALEMGASYQPDWNDECTLLLTAFVNTPKFKQVMAQSGTIVSKDWISECYRRRELVDIGNYLLFSGNSWRKGTLGDATDTGKMMRCGFLLAKFLKLDNQP
ncbi:hypothetical protein O6H91_Y473900 [Diphasiastrum complanatum]|nr:hypothetical protein O6H91_Y473900 [Diphasiastrum complanatum]